MLRVKSLDDIIYVKINPEKERIDIAPNLEDVLYMYKSVPFAYGTLPRYPGHPYTPLIEKCYAWVGKAIYFFRDRKSGKKVQFPYYSVEVWKGIDTKYRDVFLMHELSEMRNKTIGKQSPRIAHKRAKRKTKWYLKKYLSPEEIRGFRKMLRLLPKRKSKEGDAKVEVITIKNDQV